MSNKKSNELTESAGAAFPNGNEHGGIIFLPDGSVVPYQFDPDSNKCSLLLAQPPGAFLGAWRTPPRRFALLAPSTQVLCGSSSSILPG